MRSNQAKRGSGYQHGQRELRVTVGSGGLGRDRDTSPLPIAAGEPEPYVEGGIEWTWCSRSNGYVSRLGRRAAKLDHPNRKRMPRKTDSSRHFQGLTQSGGSGGAGQVPSDPLRLEAEQDGFDRREHGHNPTSTGKATMYGVWGLEGYAKWLEGGECSPTWEDGRRPKPEVQKDPIRIRIAEPKRLENRHATSDVVQRRSRDTWDPVRQCVVTDERFARAMHGYRTAFSDTTRRVVL